MKEIKNGQIYWFCDVCGAELQPYRPDSRVVYRGEGREVVCPECAPSQTNEPNVRVLPRR